MKNREIAKALDYRDSMITQIKNGQKKMSPEKAKLAGRLFGVDPFIFMKGDDYDLEKIRRAFDRPVKVMQCRP